MRRLQQRFCKCESIKTKSSDSTKHRKKKQKKQREVWFLTGKMCPRAKCSHYCSPLHSRGVSSPQHSSVRNRLHPAAAGDRYSHCVLLPAQGWGRIPCRSPSNPRTHQVLELWEHFCCFLVPMLCTLSCYSLDYCHSALQCCPSLSSTPGWLDSRLDMAFLFTTSDPLVKSF